MQDPTMFDASKTQRPTTRAAEELLGLYFPVLDHGFVSLVDYMGGDEDVARAARVSKGRGQEVKSDDRGLLRYLYKHRHTSPFEMVELKFHCKMPIFVARQWVRHRTASLNEVSGRYGVLPTVFYTPPDEQLRFQSKENKQGRDGLQGPGDQLKEMVRRGWENQRRVAVEQYNWLNYHDFAHEIARIDLPLSTYTEWYWKIDMHNLLHFLSLRVDPHAQWEIRQYAEVMAGMLKRVAPLTHEAWVDYDLRGVRLSRMELELLRQHVRRTRAGDLDCAAYKAPYISSYITREDASSSGLSGREADEFWGLFCGDDDEDLPPREAMPAADHELDLSLARPTSYFDEPAGAKDE